MTTEDQPGVEAEWLRILGGRSMADIARGVARCEEIPGKFPPGAGEFRALCQEFQRGTFAGNAVPRETHLGLPFHGGSVSGDARAYLDMCKRIVSDGGLTRAELETLPSLITHSGNVVKPSEFCTATDDPEFVKGEKQPRIPA